MDNSPRFSRASLDPYLALIQQLKDTLTWQSSRPFSSEEIARALPPPSGCELDRLSGALSELAQALTLRQTQARKLAQLFAQTNAGVTLNEVLDQLYQHFHGVIPYNRIGVALLEENNRTVRAVWVKSDQTALKLKTGYAAPLAGSSLETILLTGQARILNDLKAYLMEKPYSAATRLIVAEGMHSSLTCPLIANQTPIGFIFFSSAEAHSYAQEHVEFFQNIANPVAIAIERGWLVAELAAKQAAIEERDRLIRQINDQRSAFMSIAAHDLRGPIGNVQLVSQLLLEKDNPLPEEQQLGLLGDITRQTAHILQLIDDLLDITHIQVGKLTLEKKGVEVSAFVEETISQHLNTAAHKQTHILLDRAPQGQALADPVRLQQALDNLISNAIKYSPPASTIRVRVEHRNPWWAFYVQDQGPGITEEDRAHLYQEFSRLSARPTGGEKSVGLGLAITRWIVEAHGGRIQVDSQPGQGATFWFTIPDEL